MIEIKIDVQKSVKEITKVFAGFEKQIPYAVSVAINETAKKLKGAEMENFRKQFDMPTPFTVDKSIGITYAKKSNLQGEVFVKEKQAVYMTPYETGGNSIPADIKHPAMLKPIPGNMPLNQYGNIPYRKIQQLLANPKKFFIGTVTFKSGKSIAGIWERVNNKIIGTQIKFNVRAQQFRRQKAIRGGNTLKLLVRFEHPYPVKKHLGYMTVAQATVDTHFKNELMNAMVKAIATAR